MRIGLFLRVRKRINGTHILMILRPCGSIQTPLFGIVRSVSLRPISSGTRRSVFKEFFPPFYPTLQMKNPLQPDNVSKHWCRLVWRNRSMLTRFCRLYAKRICQSIRTVCALWLKKTLPRRRRYWWILLWISNSLMHHLCAPFSFYLYWQNRPFSVYYKKNPKKIMDRLVQNWGE